MAAKRIVLGAGGLGLVVVGAAVGLATRRQAAAWRAADELTAEELMRLPDGSHPTVTTTDGASLAVLDAGSGPAVLMAHGWTETSGVWSGVARRLVESGHRVILYDQRGHGRSTVGEDGITIARLGQDLRDLLTSLDLRDVVLVGHSMGGMTIMSLVGEAPEVVADRAAALVLVSTAAGGLGRAPRFDAIVGRALGGAAATRLFAGRAGPRLARGAVGRTPRYSHLAATAAMWVDTAGATRSGAFLAMAGMDLRELLASIKTPVTVVVGSRDQLTPPRLAREIVDRTPGAELVVVPDAGHQLPFEAPELLASIIEAAAAGESRARSLAAGGQA
jgi:pimeloyl-ACP methyl ester carboxylesterase